MREEPRPALRLAQGWVAGEALANHLMEGHHAEGSVQPPHSDEGQQSEMGGTDFGGADNSSWDDGLGGVAGDSGGDWR